jgi:hypothetical protein
MINPIVIDLYISRNKLFFIEKSIDGYGSPEEWPQAFFDFLLDISDEFYNNQEEAIKLLGYSEVEKQLQYLERMAGKA